VSQVTVKTDRPAAGEPAALSTAVTGKTPWQIFWRNFREDRLAIAGGVFIFALIALALCAPLISRFVVHHGPNEQFLFSMLNRYGLPKGPSTRFWFGANSSGQDLLVRVLYGARTSLIVAFFATGFEMVIGVALGVLAGFYGGKIDTLISRATDVVLALPVLLLALGLVSACGLAPNGCAGGLIKPGLLLVSYVIGLFGWPYLARVIRGQVLSLREKEFIEASRTTGARNIRVMLTEILPNIVAPIIVYTTLIIPQNILFEATLSFLGIGVPATTPSWGREIADASTIFQTAWWTMVFPGTFLLLTTLAFNLVGDGLRDALDPHAPAAASRRRRAEGRRSRSEEVPKTAELVTEAAA
jgi:peptide/nickel transport system permease protein